MEVQLQKKIDELVNISNERGCVTHSDFLDPQTQTQAAALLNKRKVEHVFCGGYEGAERSALFLLPAWMEEPFNPGRYLGAVNITPSDGQGHTHPEYLGSVLALGISRAKLGDIVVNGTGAFLVAFLPMAGYIEANLTRISRTSAQCRFAGLEEITAGSRELTKDRCTVSSLRADSVVSAVFGLPRAKAAQAIESGALTVNWTEMLKPDKQLTPGDMINLRGHGRARIGQEVSQTRKGRTAFYAVREK